MKKFVKSLGVTLLEVMLVLAIAAMIIVMSVRYYQSANASQNVNIAMSAITAIVSSADGMAQGGGTYAGTTTASITSLVPNGTMTAPWGGAITISAPLATGFTINLANAPANVCPLIKSKISANARLSSASVCAAAAPSNLAVVYDSTK